MKSTGNRIVLIVTYLLVAVFVSVSGAFAETEAISQAESELAQGNYVNVFAICNGLLEADWTDAGAHIMMGNTFEALEETESAMACYRQAAKILAARVSTTAVDDENALADRRKLAWVSAKLAVNAHEIGDKGAVVEFGQQAYYLGSTDKDALLTLANTYIDAENYSLAMPALKRALAAYKANEGIDDYAAEAHYQKGICHYYANEFVESCAEYALAESFGQNNLTFYGNWAFSLEGAGEWRNALDMWIKVSEMDCPETHLALVKEHIKTCEEMLKGG